MASTGQAPEAAYWRLLPLVRRLSGAANAEEFSRLLLVVATLCRGRMAGWRAKVTATNPFALLLLFFREGGKLGLLEEVMGIGEWEASASWVSFLTDGLLHSFPQLALSLWFYLKVMQTGQTYRGRRYDAPNLDTRCLSDMKEVHASAFHTRLLIHNPFPHTLLRTPRTVPPHPRVPLP
jgi:hypothetical protein